MVLVKTELHPLTAMVMVGPIILDIVIYKENQLYLLQQEISSCMHILKTCFLFLTGTM